MDSFFTALNKYFDKIYVLTIPSATERQKGFENDMKGLDYEFFFGMDKQMVTEAMGQNTGLYDDTLARKLQRYGKGMTISEIACAIGHRLIYEDMLNNGIQKALIFEDDAFPLSENCNLVNNIIETIPPDWDVLFFDYNKNEKKVFLKRGLYHIQHSIGFLKWNHTLIKNLFPKNTNTYWKTAGYHDFANAYAITLKAAEQLVKMQTPVTVVADNLLANAVTHELLKGYICIPKLFSQKSAGEFKSIDTLVDKSLNNHP